MERKLADRRSNFKKNFDDPRRKREDLQLQIRKTHREQNLAKKRMEAFEPQQQQDAASFLGIPGGVMGGEGLMSSSSSSSSTSAAAAGGLLGSAGAPAGGGLGDTFLQQQQQQVVMGCGVGGEKEGLGQDALTTGAGAGTAGDMNNNNNNNEGQQQQQEAEVTCVPVPITKMTTGGKKFVFTGSELPEMMRMLTSEDPEEVFRATEMFRRALSIESKPPIQEVIDAGAVPLFVRLLECDDRPRLQFEAAWALTNIASGTQEQTQVVIQHGAVPIFVKLLSSPTDDVREQAVWALGNIAGDSPQCRNLVLQAGALSPLLKQLNEPDVKYTMKRNATWTLSNLCRGKPQPPFEWVEPALSTLSLLIYSTDVEVVTDACWALSYLSDGTNDRIDAILEAAVSRRLVELLGHYSPLVQTPALRTVGNIVTGDDRQTEVVIQCGAVPALLKLLSSPKKAIQKEACWTVSNITAGNRDQIQRVLNEGLLPRLIELLKWGDFDVRREAAWAVSNAASGGNDEQVESLVKCGCIGPLCDLLKTADVKIVSVALEALENVLRVGKVKMETMQLRENPYCRLIEEANGLTVLEKLQDATSHEIYDKAWRIICTYFPHEEVDEGNEIEVDSSTMLDATTDSNNTFEADTAVQQQVFGAAAPQGGFHFGE